MAIQITTNLHVVPQQVSLPASIVLEQDLISNHSSETVVTEYSMAAGHDVWFELADGTPSKSVTFSATVTDTGTTLQQPARLVRHVGTPLDVSVGIDQRITDATGHHLLDHTFVTI